MVNTKNNIIYDFLSSFFSLFGACVNDYIVVDNKKILGTIEWYEETEKQHFSWVIELETSNLVKIGLLCKYITQNNLIRGDKIIISENELAKKLSKLQWDILEAQKNIDCLCSIEMKMVDNDEETDSFFVHF